MVRRNAEGFRFHEQSQPLATSACKRKFDADRLEGFLRLLPLDTEAALALVSPKAAPKRKSRALDCFCDNDIQGAPYDAQRLMAILGLA